MITQSAEIGEKMEAFQASQQADAALGERYQILKDILMSRYQDDNESLKVYGITPVTPRTHSERIDASENLIEGNQRMTTLTDPLALPSAMITSLSDLVTEAKEKFYTAGIERRESEVATAALISLYDADSKKLRALYNWVIAHWGKYDPRLIDLGFVTANDNTGGTKPPIPINLAYNSSSHLLTWDNVEEATSYQLVSKLTGSTNEWEELYTGDLPECVFTQASGDWSFKVRSRNSNGYGDWSTILDVNIHTGPGPTP